MSSSTQNPSPADAGSPPDRPAPWAGPVALVRAAHPRQAVLTAVAVAVAAALSGRASREVALVALTVLVGQAILGWLDDLADVERDARRDRARKPVADGRLDAGTVSFAIVIATLLVVPLATAHGVPAAAAYLGSLVIAAVGDRLLHARPLSWLPWAASFALYPVFLSYGGWAGQGTDIAPHPLLIALAALLGVCTHVVVALPGLVADHEEGERSFPLLVALRVGTARLLTVMTVIIGVLVIALLVVGRTVGLG